MVCSQEADPNWLEFHQKQTGLGGARNMQPSPLSLPVKLWVKNKMHERPLGALKDRVLLRRTEGLTGKRVVLLSWSPRVL